MEDFYEDLEDLLIESDLGISTAAALVDELRGRYTSSSQNWSQTQCVDELKNIIRPSLISTELHPPENRLSMYLVLGVNGVGKTTTIAKMAHRFIKNGLGPVTLAAGDTYRAAAVEQLEILADRVGARIVKQHHGSDPAAVIYDAITSARNRGDRVVLADTAGRMHNKVNLVRELEKINRIIEGKLGENDTCRKILVVDATTGQNGMRQAEAFHEAVRIDAVCMTKYDSSAKGGLITSIGRDLQLPIAFLGKGEKMDDLHPFDPEQYLEELLDQPDE